MTKYTIAFALLAMLALFKSLHVSSLPSNRNDADNRASHSTIQQYNMDRGHHRPHKTTAKHHHSIHHHDYDSEVSRQRQRQRKVKRHSNVNSESSNDDDRILAAHIQRHKQHKLEELIEHPQHYGKTRQKDQIALSKRTEQKENLKTMPRPWDHMRMHADAPANQPSNQEEDNDNDNDNDIDNEDSGINDIANDDIDSNFDNSQPSDIPIDYNDIGGDNNSTHRHHNPRSREPTSKCPKCEAQRKVEHISPEELTKVRIEFVKNQILEKLRLKKPPNVSAIRLPKPIYEGVTIQESDDESKKKELDDYYARTTKKFIFLEQETRECERTGINPSMCFSFKIDDADADAFDVSTAVLWIYKTGSKTKLTSTTSPLANANSTLKTQETIVVSDVQQSMDAKFRPIAKPITIQTVDVQDKWLEIDIEWPIKRWFGNHDLSHLIQISCESCDIKSMEEMISVHKDYRPFIMVNAQNRRRTSRQKRGINCTDGVTECCREKLYISFAEIGWDWIIQPRGYDAYFCRGSCSTVASVAQSSSHHTTVLSKATNRGNGHKPLELIPCCTAKQYSSLELFFMDSNNTATQMKFPNMVVESCGCR